jgi:3-hydroxyisobutyrate dehydrogenase-like beta-hydroxyacid dehydrogenase
MLATGPPKRVKVGFIGTGNMGLPMARNLLRAGHSLAVHNRTAGRAELLAGEGATIVSSPSEAAHDAEVVVTMLSDDPAVRSVVFDHGLLEALPPGAIHLGMSTISVACSRQLAEAHTAAGQGYVAGPVFGRPDAAAAAKLLIVAAGASQHIEACRPLMEALGRAVSVVGADPWVANVVKVTGNMLIASTIEALGEAFALQRKWGVAPRAFLEIVNGALFNSPLYANYGGLIADERYEPAGFRLRLGLKDTRLVLEAADAVSVPLPLASLLRDHFLAAVANGKGDMDWAALAQLSAENAGLGKLSGAT